jgi:hypothetical protein
MGDGIWFVYRCPYEGPSAIRVRRLPDATPLAWFQRTWTATADEDRVQDEGDAHRWVDHQLAADLGGDVYGLASLFVSAPWHDPPPDWDRQGRLPARTWQELRDLLRQHLYVEGPPEDQVRVDEHSVRAKTDDDEADVAYFFIDDTLARTAPDRAAYLLLEDWRLPAGARPARSGFQAPIPIRTLAAQRPGAGTTWAVVLGVAGDFGETPPVAFAGVRLPQLAQLLRAVRPAHTEPDPRDRDRLCCWPYQLLALRALVGPADRTLGPALRRYNRWAWLLEGQVAIQRVRQSAAEDHPAARAGLERVLRIPTAPDWRRQRRWRDPTRSRLHTSRHLVQAAIHVDQLFGYERWYLFDDVWARAHPDLAASLLRSAAGWDPFQD